MALTAYAGGIVAVWLTGTLDYDTNGPWLLYILVTTAAATVWRLVLGRGPLERLLTWSSRRAAGRELPAGRSGTGGGPDAS
jgi:hypothetical protein